MIIKRFLYWHFMEVFFFENELMSGLILNISFDNGDSSMKIKFTEDSFMNYDRNHIIFWNQMNKR